MRENVASCCHPVARNVATLVIEHQRCNRCCHFSNFSYLLPVVDTFTPPPLHFSIVKSLLEIEEAIAKLPAKDRKQLVRDIPALCSKEFPKGGWDAILADDARETEHC